jgi:uncharacterized membrane protein
MVENSRRIAFIAMLGVVLLSLYFYSELPAQMATHWNAYGVANGFMDKDIALFLLPGISFVVYVILMLVPYFDPLGKNIRHFHDSYELMALSFVLFLSYIQGLTILANLGRDFNMVVALIPAFAGLLFILGRMLAVAKRNWFVGIRTPWTLSSEKVWNRTHSLGSKMYQASALLTLGGVLMQDEAAFFLLVPVLATSIFLVVYSYMEYRKLG